MKTVIEQFYSDASLTDKIHIHAPTILTEEEVIAKATEIAKSVYKSVTKNHVRLERYNTDCELADQLFFNLLNRVTKLEKMVNELYYPYKKENE
jgi:hypothetical protein